MARRARSRPSAKQSDSPVDLNQIISQNLRTARENEGWTQEELATRLGHFLGKVPSVTNISAMERAAHGGVHREFDFHDIALFARVFDLPVLWFLLPEPGDDRQIRGLDRTLGHLYILLLGRNDQLDELVERMKQLGGRDPTPLEKTMERISGRTGDVRKSSYLHRRKEMLLAYLHEHTDRLDQAATELRQLFEHIEQVGIRGFVAEHTNDDTYLKRPSTPDREREADNPA